jgi:Tat protein secretion system quality control protein TatD with DNase activity
MTGLLNILKNFSTHRQVLHIVAAIRGVEPENLAEKVWDNTWKVFFA